MPGRKFIQRYLSGYTSQRGVKFVRVENKQLFAYVPLMMFTTDEGRAKTILTEAGISTPGGAWRELLDDIAALTEFPPRLIADRNGWNGNAFLFADGQLVAGEDESEPAIAVSPDPGRCSMSGSLEGWIEAVAERIAGQNLLMAAVLMSFAAPLVELIGRNENFGFELVGPGGTGKSLAQRLAASVSRNTDVPSFNATVAGLEPEMEACNGQLLALDEANSFYGERSRGGAGTAMKSFAFRLAGGKPTQRFQGPRPQRYFYVFLTSSNQPLASIAGAEHQASVRAAGDRLMTLNISASRPHGAFDSVPREFGSAEEFAKALDAAAAAHHGHAMRAFICELVDEVARDREAVVAGIRDNIRAWRERAGIGFGDNGAQGRVADAFGLLYAAGRLAQHYDVIPSSWGCGAALVSVYQDFYTGAKPPVPIDDLIRAHLRKPMVRDLDRQGLRRMGPVLFARTPAFLKRNRRGRVEARIPSEQAERHLPGLRDRIASSQAGVRLVPGDRGHMTVKREVRNGHPPDRVIALELPDGFI